MASDDTPFLIKPSISQKLSPGLSFHLQTHIASGVHGALIMDLALEYNHVALLQHRAKNSGDTVLFKWPILRGSEPSQEWKNVTVAEFAAEVDRVAGFLLTELTARGIPNRSVVTLLWVFFYFLCFSSDAATIRRFSGSDLQHVIYTVALARLSYIPQICPMTLTHPEIIFALMEKAGSRMILYGPSLENATTDCPFPKMALTPIETLESPSSDVTLPAIEDLSSSPSDFCFIYLTSGSTSGSPKVVPLTQKFISIYYKTQFGIWLDGKSFDTQDVFIWRGSICAVASIIRAYSRNWRIPSGIALAKS